MAATTEATPSYDVTTYLLDRANIQDTLLKQVIYYDLRDAHRLETEVYAPECSIDYTALFGGGEPLETTNTAWAAEAVRLTESLDSAQHVNSGSLVQLPQPGPKAGDRPDTAAVVCNGGAHMVRKAAEGGSIAHNGGRMGYKMVRLRELEEKGENPWRIRRQKYTPYWLDGNVRVTDSMKSSFITV